MCPPFLFRTFETSSISEVSDQLRNPPTTGGRYKTDIATAAQTSPVLELFHTSKYFAWSCAVVDKGLADAKRDHDYLAQLDAIVALVTVEIMKARQGTLSITDLAKRYCAIQNELRSHISSSPKSVERTQTRTNEVVRDVLYWRRAGCRLPPPEPS